MLRKLIKYDLLFGSKRYSILAVLLCGSWLTGLAISLVGNYYLNAAFLALNLLMSILLIGSYVVTSLQFFYNALSGYESYFNYTIPVKTVKLIFSKLVVVWLWGGILIGVLVLTWFSLYNTLLVPLGFNLGIQWYNLWPIARICICQFLMASCLLAFSISIFNTPRLQNTNKGMMLSAVVAYGITQIVGVLQLGMIALWQFAVNRDILQAVIYNQLTPMQENSFLLTIEWVFIVSYAVFAVLFFYLTIRTVENRRSI